MIWRHNRVFSPLLLYLGKNKGRVIVLFQLITVVKEEYFSHCTSFKYFVYRLESQTSQFRFWYKIGQWGLCWKLIYSGLYFGHSLPWVYWEVLEAAVSEKQTGVPFPIPSSNLDAGWRQGSKKCPEKERVKCYSLMTWAVIAIFSSLYCLVSKN